MYKVIRRFTGEPEAAAPNLNIGKNVAMHNTTIAPHVKIGDNCYLHECKIDSYSYLAMNVQMMNTEVGKFCSIAEGVRISLGRHPAHTFVSSSPVFFSLHKQCGTTFSDDFYFNEMGSSKIGNDVWIGTNTVIMDDVNIGNGAIIGAGSIVTKSVPPYAIAVGNPAKVIKYRFTSEEIDFLLDFEWWNKDEEWLKENFKTFHNISTFIEKNGRF